ncbi:hypothetical protein TRIATDRAFT_128986 [Trichoderma atroviride IMI 206040]|uniref:Calponin-homology (CH) domain-containing protein n=1 Tax=Hypocrea atroviridis (strain ATCC 20476 / IMI 206040) TaxID=452589 RepID=G9NML6_HYPAI|nr:uncharacterized protein TRIATDRAFT_128986 [Trichoderma atroviride IMI 206040]EHK48146.1 hypothetical protein TRIATDRAFT_128986 [Trichoderma atroviride IMI 206040]
MYSVFASASSAMSAETENRPHSPDAAPSHAIGAKPEPVRALSAASTTSRGSSTDANSRDSLGSELSSRMTRRRGFMRPQGTDFAKSAKSRESVMNLGSIAHLQYYFARTGLLDGKGGQLARKKQPRATLDLAVLEGTAPMMVPTPTSPDLFGQGFITDNVMESPTGLGELDDYSDDFEEDPDVLPPTVSTYNHRQKVVPKPPTVAELKAELETTLRDALKVLKEAKAQKAGSHRAASDASQVNMPAENTQSWYELQGMNILDFLTLAIRAAKNYYTAHELPDRLDSIKSEKQIRTDLLGVMEVLKQMAIRNFNDGMRMEEIDTMIAWIESVFDILKKEAAIEATEQAERQSWSWMTGDWTGKELERERHFLLSMDPDDEPLPEWTPASSAAEQPTPFLEAMQNGLRLVRLHNAAVKKSRRRFGAIPTFHVDTQKPYRSADNLRYWAKAAELRFECKISIDALGIVYNNGPQVWLDFEAAILKWCAHVREEITNELV